MNNEFEENSRDRVDSAAQSSTAAFRDEFITTMRASHRANASETAIKIPPISDVISSKESAQASEAPSPKTQPPTEAEPGKIPKLQEGDRLEVPDPNPNPFPAVPANPDAAEKRRVKTIDFPPVPGGKWREATDPVPADPDEAEKRRAGADAVAADPNMTELLKVGADAVPADPNEAEKRRAGGDAVPADPESLEKRGAGGNASSGKTTPEDAKSTVPGDTIAEDAISANHTVSFGRVRRIPLDRK